MIDNIERILCDINYLHADGRIAAASFFLVTADEELAKVFILIDACRLDPARHESVLRSICKAFYSHKLKYAYNAILSPGERTEVRAVVYLTFLPNIRWCNWLRITRQRMRRAFLQLAKDRIADCLLIPSQM